MLYIQVAEEAPPAEPTEGAEVATEEQTAAQEQNPDDVTQEQPADSATQEQTVGDITEEQPTEATTEAGAAEGETVDETTEGGTEVKTEGAVEGAETTPAEPSEDAEKNTEEGKHVKPKHIYFCVICHTTNKKCQ